METKFVKVNSDIKDVIKEVSDLAEKLDDQENRSRRSNLCFDGLKEIEGHNETWAETETKVKVLLEEKLEIQTDELTIERAHRVGKRVQGKTRPIVVKFANYKTKESVLKSKKNLKGSNVFVREDFSQRVLEKRKALLPQMLDERKKGNIAFLRYDKLVVYPGRETANMRGSSRSSPVQSSNRGSAWRRSTPRSTQQRHNPEPAYQDE